MSYDEFVENLALLEMLANQYVMENPGNDPVELIIKYIRTGVDRYNSGSWGIMAGYENKDFADYVRRTENAFNYEIENVDEYFKFTALKNINVFDLPNGNRADIGHMFGTLDISYTNKNSLDHGDVGGWAGDLVDLITSADADEYKVSGTIEEMVDMLEAGANDYIRKPYGKNELVARVKVALREKSMMTEIELPVGGRFVLKDLVIDYDKRQITVGGNLIRLTQTEYNILSLLSKHADKVMTYEEILHAIWGRADVGSVKKLQVNMVNIRKKIGENAVKAKYIINLPGVGYRMMRVE